MQAQVQRVQHAARARDREIRFEVRVMVPHERRHALAAFHSQALQRAAQRPCAAMEIGVAMTVEALVRQPGNDLRAGEQLPGALQEVRERERKVHHRGLHAWHVNLLAAVGPEAPAGCAIYRARSCNLMMPSP
jgi:hypothetical protein